MILSKCLNWKVYIVKLPNNMCGIGACVIDSPSKVILTIFHFLLWSQTALDSSQDQSTHKGEAGSEEGRPDNCAELHTQPPSYPRLQVWLPSLRPRHQRQPPSHLSLQGWDGEVGEVKSFLPTKNSLLRFAMEKFSLEPDDLENTFIHLTNFAQVLIVMMNFQNASIHLLTSKYSDQKGRVKNMLPWGMSGKDRIGYWIVQQTKIDLRKI